MKQRLHNNIIALSAIILLSGCATFGNLTPEQKVERLSYAAASIGVQTTLLAKPEHRPLIEKVYSELTLFSDSGVITGAKLREILAQLPIKELKSPTAVLLIGNATVLYDTFVGDAINVENNVYVKAATEGIREGMKAGLEAVPAPAVIK